MEGTPSSAGGDGTEAVPATPGPDLGPVVRLWGRSLVPSAAVVVVAIAAMAVALVPLYVWSANAALVLGFSDADQTTPRQLTALVVAVLVPLGIVLVLLGATVVGAVAIVAARLAQGLPARPVGAFRAAIRTSPRTAAVVALVLGSVFAAFVATPFVVVAGLAALVLTPLARRLQRRWARLPWPTTRALVVAAVPFGLAAAVAVRWALVLPAVVVERRSIRSAFGRSIALTRPQITRVAVAALAFFLLPAVVITLINAQVGEGATSFVGPQLVSTIGGMVFMTLGVVAITYLLTQLAGPADLAFAEAPAAGRDRTVGVLLVLAVLAAAVPIGLAWGRPAPASAAGASIVVDDLGDAPDAAPGDGTCATSAGSCTLRAALDEANQSSGEVIGFGTDGTITVGSTLSIGRPLIIDGSGHRITVSGGGSVSVFQVGIEVAGGGSAAIHAVTITGGYDASTGGGAIFNSSASGGEGLVLDRVTIRGNTSAPGAAFGGAVVNVSKLTVRNSTFSGNVADPTTDGSDIANVFSGTAAISESTFAGSSGSSAIASSSSNPAEITNSIVSGPGFACSGSFTGSGNVTVDASAICPGTSGVTTEALGLTALADNGGSTATIRLLPSSRAVDAGDPAACSAADQRGASRPKGAGCDAGAYELDARTGTTLTATPASTSFGSGVALRATVSALGEPVVPTGSVELFDGSTSLGTAALDSLGAADKVVASLRAGTHSITAVYRPGAGLAGSTSAAETVTVSPAATTVKLTSSGSPTRRGEAVTFRVEVTASGGTVPTGTVTVSDGTTVIQTKTLDGAGRAEVVTAALTGGPHVMVADYSGDADHAGGRSPALAHEIVGESATELWGPTSSTVYGTDAVFLVKVSPAPGGAVPTGRVTLESGATTVGSATLNGTGGASIPVAVLPPGSNSVVAHYEGDGFNGASSSAAVTHEVTAADTVTSLSLSPSPSNVHGTPLTMDIRVTAPGTPATPTGTVTIYDGATVITSATIGPDGTSRSPMPALPAGSYSLRAEYAGATGFRPSTAPVVVHQVVRAGSTVTLQTSAPSSVSGEQVTLTATVTSASSPLVPVGSVTFRDGSTDLGTVAVDAAGVARLDTRAIAVGSRTLTASFDGGTDFTATATTKPHTVSKAAVSVSVASAPARTWYGSLVTIDVIVTAVAPGTGTPTGTVTIRDGATVLGTPDLDGTGRATLSARTIPVGNRTITADYAGDGSFQPGSGSAAHTIDPDATTVTVLTSEPDQLYGRAVTLTAVVSGSDSVKPTGDVTFTGGSRTLGTAPLDGSGRASITVSDLPVGGTLVQASYAGDGSFAPGSGTLLQQVAAAPTATGLAVSPAAPSVADLVTLTATVTAPGASLTPGGSVGFYDGDVLIGTAPLDGSGKAALSQRFDRRQHEIQARFLASTSWKGSSSGVQALTPSRVSAALLVAASPTPVQVGRAVTLTAGVSTVPGVPAPTGVIHFTDATGPLGSAQLIDGVATLTVTAPLVPGAWVVSGWYPGDGNHEPVAPTAATVDVQTAPTTITLVSTPNPGLALDGPVTVRAWVTSPYGGAPVSGTVRFTSDSAALTSQTVAVGASGIAEITITDIAAGTWNLGAEYLPAAGSPFSPSTATSTHASVKRSSMVEIEQVTGLVVGRPTRVAASVVDPTASGYVATGTITITGPGGATCTVAAPSGSCAITIASSGPAAITASYSGDGRFQGDDGTYLATVSPATASLRASSPTRSWITGDPITVDWSIAAAGTPTGTVTVRSPYGVACTAPAAAAGSCTATLPFEARGTTIDFDVAYSGDASWDPAHASVKGAVLGCYPVAFTGVPAEGGTVVGTPGNCNDGAGLVEGTRAMALASPAPGYVLTRWLENDSTTLAYAFTVGEPTHTATALFQRDCVTVASRAAQAPGVDPAGSASGSARLSPAPNCGVPDQFDAVSGTTTSRYLRGTTLEATAVPATPDTGEFKGWTVSTAAGNSSYPTADTIGLDLTGDVDLTANFGARCYQPELVPDGPGTAEITTAPNCFDADGQGFVFGTFVAIDAEPGPLHYVGDLTSSSGYSIDPTVYGIRSDDPVTVHFEPCRKLTTATGGSGKGEVTVSVRSTCPDGAPGYYVPGEVTLEAVPAPAGTGAFGLPIDGDHFKRWVGNGGEPIYERSNPIRVDMSQDRDITAVFSSSTHCAPITVATGSPGWIGGVEISQDPAYECGTNEYYQGQPFTLRADVLKGAPLTQWKVAGLGDYESAAISGKSTRAPDRTRYRTRLGSGTVEVAPMYGNVTATAYACTAVAAEAGILGKDGNIVEGADAPDNFILYDTEPSCPGTGNGWLAGDTVGYFAGAQPVGWEFAGWQGDAEGRSPEGKLVLDGTRSNLMVRSLYRPICFTLTVTPPEHTYRGMDGDCPESEPSDNRYMGGSTVALHAAGGGEVWVGWEGDAARPENPTWVYVDQDSEAHAAWRNRTDKEKTVKFFEDFGDALAVGAKKLLGVGILAVNAMISNTATLALSAISMAATAIDAIAGALGEPTDGKFREVLTGIQQTADLWSSPFSCGAEWAFSNGDNSQSGNGGDLKDVIKDPKKMGEKLGSYRASLQAAEEGSGKYMAAIKKFGVKANAAKSVGTLGLTAYGVGDALTKDDLGWDDTAEEAWGSAGGRAFLQCMDRAIPDYMGIPPLDVQGA